MNERFSICPSFCPVGSRRIRWDGRVLTSPSSFFVSNLQYSTVQSVSRFARRGQYSQKLKAHTVRYHPRLYDDKHIHLSSLTVSNAMRRRWTAVLLVLAGVGEAQYIRQGMWSRDRLALGKRQGGEGEGEQEVRDSHSRTLRVND